MPGTACLFPPCTEEEARKETFGEAPGIPVRHLETLQGGAVLNDRPWFLSPRSSVQRDTADPRWLTRIQIEVHAC